MHKIKIQSEAEEELLSASLYYEERVAGLGEEFLDGIEEAISKIRKYPLAWPVYEDDYRRYLMKRFPYGVVYRVEADIIFVIAVAHLSRKPDYWKSR